MPHPDEGLIHAWLDGELDAAEAARIEALVASDPEWAAAAAEARGLLAASSRIVGSLDRVPANVIPLPAAAPRRAGRRWLLRAAAVLVLLGGSAVVLNRASTDTGEVTFTVPLKQPAAAPAIASVPVPAVAQKSSTVKKELAEQKQKTTLADKNLSAPAAESRADAAAGGAGAGGAAANMATARRAAAAPPPPPRPPPPRRRNKVR